MAVASSIREMLGGHSGQQRAPAIKSQGVNPLPIHLHRHVYWMVPLFVVGVILLVYWALTSGDKSRGPQL